MGLVALTVTALSWAVRPFGTPSVGPDAAAPVVHFQHLVRLDPVDGAITQTAKPLLTILYGSAHAIAGWFGVVSITIVAAGMFVALGALLAYRLAGLIAAGFVGAAFAVSPILLRDVALAYALPWAGLCLLAAGLALTGMRRRWAVAGVLLALSTLARPEALAVVAFACACLVAADAHARLRGRPPPPRSAYLLFVGFIGLPVFLIHDAIVMADPAFWLETARRNTEAMGTEAPLLMLVISAAISVGLYAPLLGLALIGVASTVLRRNWVAAVGILGVTAGIGAFLVLTAARGTAVPTRYLGLVYLGMTFAAGLGAAALDVPALRRRLRSPNGPQRFASALAALAIGGIVGFTVAPNWLIDREHLQYARNQVQLHENHAIAMATLRAVLQDGDALPADAPAIYVPRRLRVQTVVDLGLPLSAVGRLGPGLVTLPRLRAHPNITIYHDRLDDAPDGAWQRIEIEDARVLDGVRITPLLADPDRGMWVVRVEPTLD